MRNWLKRMPGWERESGKPDPPRGAGLGEKKHDGAQKADRHALTTVPPVQVESATRGEEILPESYMPHPMAETKTDRDDTAPKSDPDLIARMRAGWNKARNKSTTAWDSTETARSIVSRNGIASEAAKRWSFLWSAAAGWVLGFQFLLALYDRIIGTFSLWNMPRGQYLLNGGQAAEWGLLDGPAKWTKETLANAWETQQTTHLVIAVAIGLLPLIADSVTQRFTTNHGPRKWTLTVIYGAPLFWVSMSYYFPFMGYKAWWEVQLTALTALAWWGWSMSKGRSAGLAVFLMRIPLAALVTGALAYSPGAVF